MDVFGRSVVEAGVLVVDCVGPPLQTAPLNSRVPVSALTSGRLAVLWGGAAAPKLCIVESAHAAADVGENISSGAPLVTLC